ncbi:MAG: putative DNA-binding domain-containing protein [Gammaproteobacteria bacterium]|nr:putative DNA-binding domain-containing protein [Gammaproteobacteria bacterium]
MHSLRDLQLEMGQLIVVRQLNAVPDELISDHFSSRERLTVYRNNFVLGHHEALAAVYPVIKRLGGEAFFGALAEAYRQHDPRTSANVHAYGVTLAEFLKDFLPAKALPYLSDIARLEWAYHEVFHAGINAEASLVLNAAEMNDDGVLIPHPALRWLESQYPVLEIWQQHRRDELEEIDLGSGGDRLLIYRTDFDVEIVRLGVSEYALVTALAGGVPVGEVFTAYADQTDVATVMAFCLSRRIFIGLKQRGKADESSC